MNDFNTFKEKLYNHTMPVNERLWDSLESRLPSKKEERRFPVFWLILFLSTALGGALMLSRLDDQNKNILPPPSQGDMPHLTSTEKSEVTSGSPVSTTTSVPTTPKSNDLTNSTITSKSKILTPTNITIAASSSFNIPSEPVIEYEIPLQEVLTAPYARNAFTTSFLPMFIADMEDDKLNLEMASIMPDPNCYKFGGTGTRFALSADLFGGPGFSPRTFEDTGGESTVYAAARKNTERNQYAWGAGARLNLHLSNGLAARIGLLYEQTGDLFDYTDSLASMSTTRIDSFWSSNGTFLYADTVRVFIPGTLIKKIHNTYRHLDIPILFGYELPMGRTTLMVNAGPVINLTSSHKGQILDSNLAPRHITPGAPGAINTYKTNVGLSIYLGAGALFPLTTHISALIEPRLIYRIKPVTLNSYPLKEHRHFAGLNLGIRYHFQ